MIETFRREQPTFLAMFAVGTFAIGAAIVGIAPLIIGQSASSSTSLEPDASTAWRPGLQHSAVMTSRGLAVAGVLLLAASFLVLAKAYLSESRGACGSGLRIIACVAYILSVVIWVSSLSATIFLIILHS